MGAGHCQWGGVADQNICDVHGDRHPMLKIRPIGPTAAAGVSVTYGRKARKYIWISYTSEHV